jgi:hypothetical protein
MEKLSRWLENNPRASKNSVEKAKLGKAEYVRLALSWLVRDGHVVTEQQGQAELHTVVKQFRDIQESTGESTE